ncbi:GNAT superfamily N-acetyltransferase [Chromobacterium alkanivorans]|uniref:GNAT family N-acetyltransferase n=1 Tax=Chromobacterium alkanivorans TaxID=1071719 RepID=UPI002168C91F|nr:GNAT family N-acetyltransferase [Chromobacterium alkanivorans]MCS3804565.1 GNAT superfamily N-acetyltransferase [Chromobacterium alkanivorans]MCS3818904.1 GNAT superfamily N-acetyltransferase [Chromobacterium alkanivorans]MCS3873238.1 GNAT superfamily N-acetyltransferase [Chromobacterium alkanivorans]
MSTIRMAPALAAGDYSRLSALLADCVAGGASVGFLAPLPEAEAAAYWAQVDSLLGAGLQLWLAEEDGALLGCVQLAPCQRGNGRHRAEVQKLLVHSACRGRGVARRLMAALEDHAHKQGIRLLVLDTEAGSGAEAVYRKLGWSKSGEIPDYAASPDGRLHPTAYYFKRL